MNFRALLFFACVSTAAAQGDGTALAAVKLIPKDAAKRRARIEAREGAPTPERWYLLVHEPTEKRGVRKFVVAGGKFVTSRTRSQFAETLKPADFRLPHSPTPIPVLTVHSATGAKANS